MHRRHFYNLGGVTIAAMFHCEAAFAGEQNSDRIRLNNFSMTVNNTVTSALSGRANWDPADLLTVTGQLRDNGGGNCGDVGVVANADRLIVTIENAGHARCGGQSFTVTPGTDANGNFSFSMKGGGVSFPGTVNGVTEVEGSYVKLVFEKGRRCPESCGICLTQSPEGVVRCLPDPRSFALGRLWTSISSLRA